MACRLCLHYIITIILYTMSTMQLPGDVVKFSHCNIHVNSSTYMHVMCMFHNAK